MSATRPNRMLGVGLLLAALLAGAIAPASHAQQGAAPQSEPSGEAQLKRGERDGREFKDWELNCVHPTPDAPEACEMRQRVVDENGRRVLLAVVGRLPNTEELGMLIVLPLGIALPPGVMLKIDDGEEKGVPVERCEAGGCRIEMILEPTAVERFKAGTRINVGFQIYDRAGKRRRIDVPISLMGFSAAVNEVLK